MQHTLIALCSVFFLLACGATPTPIEATAAAPATPGPQPTEATIPTKTPTPTNTPASTPTKTPQPEITTTEAPPSEAVPEPTRGGVAITTIYYDGKVIRVESDEYIEITNQGDEPVDLTGWKINAGDEGQDFFFPSGFVMQPGQACRIYTNEDHPETCGLSFSNSRAIWNNKGDTGYLYDAQGGVVSEWSY